jgi:hypothetical protein
MSLAVDCVCGVRGRSIDQAEDPPGAFIDPVLEVVDVVRSLGLKVGLVSLCNVIDAHAPGDLVNVHVKRHVINS